MRAIILWVIFIAILFTNLYSIAPAESKDFAPQKFTVTYTITYNSLTLEEAAKKELAIKESNKEACEVKVELKKLDNVALDTVAYVDFPGNMTSDAPGDMMEVIIP